MGKGMKFMALVKNGFGHFSNINFECQYDSGDEGEAEALNHFDNSNHELIDFERVAKHEEEK